MLQQELYNLQCDVNKIDNYSNSVLDQLRNKILNDLPLYKVLSPQIINFPVDEVANIARKIKDNFTDIIIISMGGANLNPAMLISSLATANKTKFHFLSSTDPVHINSKLNSIDLEKAAILTISKSGNTLETLAILAAIINLYNTRNISQADRYFFITKIGECKLFNVAKALGATIIEHDQAISGRYSGLSSVTILPALIADIDVVDYLQGATLEIENFLKNNNAAPIQSAFAKYSLQNNLHVNVVYNQKLIQFANWQSQIIAESLGKQGLGYTPVASVGPEDQHSMYQLYLDGPNDKFYSYFSIRKQVDTRDHKQLSVDTKISGLNHIAGMTLSQIHQINEDASFEALKKKGRPVRRITLDNLSAKTMGALVAFSMIETIFLGELMAINPFNQDGVELIKQEARSMVGQ